MVKEVIAAVGVASIALATAIVAPSHNAPANTALPYYLDIYEIEAVRDGVITVYPSIEDASIIENVPQDAIREAIEQGTYINGYEFRRIQ